MYGADFDLKGEVLLRNIALLVVYQSLMQLIIDI